MCLSILDLNNFISAMIGDEKVKDQYILISQCWHLAYVNQRLYLLEEVM